MKTSPPKKIHQMTYPGTVIRNLLLKAQQSGFNKRELLEVMGFEHEPAWESAFFPTPLPTHLKLATYLRK